MKAGQKLHIFPSQDYELRTYKVRSGDNLAAIARRLGVSLDHILTANGLSTKKILRPGQRLVAYVPDSGSAGYVPQGTPDSNLSHSGREGSDSPREGNDSPHAG